MNIINSIKKWRQFKKIIRHQTFQKIIILQKIMRQLIFWKVLNCYRNLQINHKDKIQIFNLKMKKI